MEHIGNIPNLSAEMENDISLMATYDGTQLSFSHWEETIGGNTDPYNYYIFDKIFFSPITIDAYGNYDPLRKIKLTFSAPPTIKLSGDRGYDNTFSCDMKYIGCKIPYCLTLESVAYTSLGNRVSAIIDNSEIYGSSKGTTINDIYTFSYMEFVFNQQLLNDYGYRVQYAGETPTNMWDGGDSAQIQIIYANTATYTTLSRSKTLNENNFELFIE